MQITVILEGDRIAQLIIERIMTPAVLEVDDLGQYEEGSVGLIYWSQPHFTTATTGIACFSQSTRMFQFAVVSVSARKGCFPRSSSKELKEYSRSNRENGLHCLVQFT
ncbi:hypothetical protein HPP92_000762 [Vanilla planifolia]|uniref:Uncharacterized protein n=1 Tax=Vanilla planifolia TaxID=51239 RepID=A0A835RY38_VANPL|nr:hypothetical protein HPP92_000762 [Vanilla planifolia]